MFRGGLLLDIASKSRARTARAGLLWVLVLVGLPMPSSTVGQQRLAGTTWALDGATVELGRGGVTVETGGHIATWRTHAYDGRRLASASPQVAGERATYQHGAIDEWWVRTDGALEHGWTVHAPPRRDPHQVVLDVEVASPTLRPVAESTAVRLVDDDGATVVTYGGLLAWDATGRELDVSVEVVEGGLRIAADVARAVYPVTVDPWVRVTPLENRRTLTAPVADAAYGASVATDGFRKLVGAPDTAPGGAVHVYVPAETGGNWLLDGTITPPEDEIVDEDFGAAMALSYELVIADPGADVAGEADAGAVYFYTYDFTAEAFELAHTLTEPEPTAGARFGEAVDLDITTILVGAPGAAGGGEAHEFRYNSIDDEMTHQRVLANPTPAAGDEFGSAVALPDGSGFLVVGAPGDAANAGAVHVFQSGSPVATIAATSPVAGERFGAAVAGHDELNRDERDPWFAAGVPGAAVSGVASAGRVEIFRNTNTSENNWTRMAVLAASAPTAAASLGTSIAATADVHALILAGAPGGPGAGGALFSYGGGAWTHQATIRAGTSGAGMAVNLEDGDTDWGMIGAPAAGRAHIYDVKPVLSPWLGEPDDAFGGAIAVAGDTAVVGNSGTFPPAPGKVFVFTRDAVGTWSRRAAVSAPGGTADDEFGAAIDLDEGTLAVGAPGAAAPGLVEGVGAVYVFTGSGATWTHQATLYPPSLPTGTSFGGAVAIDGDTIVVGAGSATVGGDTNAGRAYVYTREGTTWTHRSTLASPTPQPNGYFGEDVDVTGNDVIVGSYGETGTTEPGGGSVHIFARSDDTWTHAQRLRSPRGAASDEFGERLAASGDRLLVADEDARNAADTAGPGEAYVYVRDASGAWSLEQTLPPPDGANNGSFGEAVGLDGDVAAITDYRWTVGEVQPGRAYVYVRDGAGTWVLENRLSNFEAGGSGFGRYAVAVGGRHVLVDGRTEDTVYVHTSTNRAPTVDAGGPYVGDAGDSVTVEATGSDPDGDTLTYRWDLDADGAFDDAVGASASVTLPDEAGTLDVAVQVNDGNGVDHLATDTASIRVDAADPGPTNLVRRCAGEDRIETAICISRLRYADAGGAGQAAVQRAATTTAGGVVLARSFEFPDALAGGPFAASEDAPLLLTATERLDDRVLAEIDRVLGGAGTVWLLGGEAALEPAVASAVAAAGYDVARLGGETRFETAVLIAEATTDAPGAVMLTTAWKFPDALTAGPAAATLGGVVLLTDADRPHPVTARYLAGVGGVRWAIGGDAAKAHPDAGALVGETRHETAVLVAETLFDAPALVGIARSDVFADALGAGAYLARVGAPLLLTPSDVLHPQVGEYLTANRGAIGEAILFGGEQALFPQVEAEVQSRI